MVDSRLNRLCTYFQGRLGANAILGVSLAVLKAGAAEKVLVDSGFFSFESIPSPKLF